MRRLSAIGGIVGPAAFIGAWVAGARRTEVDYSSIDDAISRLAAVGADTRPLMTAGFIGFGVALPAFAFALRHSLDGPAWIAAAATGISTLAVAATPLDSSATVDKLHAAAATIGYITLAATPLLAARPLMAGGHWLLARAGLAAASVSAVSLGLTLTDLPHGLFQRLGLTVSDLWIVATAVAMLSGRLVTREMLPARVPSPA